MKTRAITRYTLTGFLLSTFLTLTLFYIQKPITHQWSHEQFLYALQQRGIQAVTIAADRSQSTVTTQDGEIIQVNLPTDTPKLLEPLSLIQAQVNFGPPNEPRVATRLLATLLIPILFLTFQIFWIWTLIDCAMKESSEGNTKLVWVIIILFTNLLGALIYFFIRRPQRRIELGH